MDFEIALWLKPLKYQRGMGLETDIRGAQAGRTSVCPLRLVAGRFSSNCGDGWRELVRQVAEPQKLTGQY